MDRDGGLRESPSAGYALAMEKSWRPAAVIGLGLVGAVVSAYLTALHLRHLSTGVPSLCNFSATLNCDVVNTSAHSEILGTPISHLGTLFYLAMMALGGAALAKPPLRPRLHGYLFLGALFAVGYSLFLAAISLQLGALCVFCASLYVVNLGLLIVLGAGGLSSLRRLGSGFFSDLRDFSRSPALLVTLLAVISALAATYQVRAAVASALALRQLKNERLDDAQRVALTTGAPAIGSPSAPITLIEISDFECPFCQRAAETVAELRRRYPNELRVVFRNFPLDTACNPLLKRQVHDNACAAARAALCVDKLAPDKFFPYAERLFQDGVEPADLIAHGKKLGLDEAQLEDCLSKKATAARLDEDLTLGHRAGVQAVPVFFINGRKLAGAQPVEVFVKIIETELSALKSRR
jgi:protein-disulfide isomerase/uncharacterized membrane protein